MDCLDLCINGDGRPNMPGLIVCRECRDATEAELATVGCIEPDALALGPSSGALAAAFDGAVKSLVPSAVPAWAPHTMTPKWDAVLALESRGAERREREETEARTVACPSCPAVPGKRCRNRKSGQPMDRAHDRRRDAAWAALLRRAQGRA